MIWYGMVWYDTVWYDMVWYMVWCGMVWYDMVWYGMVWYDMVWYGMVWYGLWDTISLFLLPARHSSGIARLLLHARFQPTELCVWQSFLCGPLAPRQFMALATQASLRNYQITTARRASMFTWDLLRPNQKNQSGWPKTKPFLVSLIPPIRRCVNSVDKTIL